MLTYYESYKMAVSVKSKHNMPVVVKTGTTKSIFTVAGVQYI